MSERLAAISIDLDETHHYRRIHGLPATSEAAHAAYDVAIDRALAFARTLGSPITFFAVGDDLARWENAERLRKAVREGHLVESHSMSHRYDLVRAPFAQIRHEVEASFDAIERAVGRRPLGFRAPGYTVSAEVLDALESVGALFDASVLPSPPYALAKVAVLFAMALARRKSSSIVGSPAALFAPTDTYRPGDQPHQRGHRPLVEIPMLVTRGPRVPVIGTSLALGGERLASALVRACGHPQVASLELHAIDFLGIDDGIGDIAAIEPQLRVPLPARIASLVAACRELRSRGYRFTTLETVARSFAGR